MNSIQQLINKMCPDGVVFVPLSNITDYDQPSKYIVKSTNYDDKYSIPVLTAGQSFILGYTNETEGLFKASKENPVIIFDDFTTSMHWVDFDFKVKSSAMKMIKTKASISQRYVYHCMKNITYKPVDHSRQWIEKYSQIKIPLPPLQIQEEIVRILDTFTELTAELTAELTLRKKQYEFYRDKLLSFDGLSEEERERLGVRWMAIGEFANCYTGATPKTQHSDYWVDGTIPWMSSGEVNKGEIFDTNEKITQNGYESCSTKMVPANTVVVALAGQGKTRGTVAITRIPLCTNQSLCSIVTNENVLSEYLLHYLKGKYVKLREISSGDGTRGGLNLKMIRDFVIPVPDIATQKTIVNILGNFEQISNSIFNGIPAEINLRQKQYEYYRDKLLSFDKGISGAY